MEIRIGCLIDDNKCYEKVRELRWSTGIRCPHCDSGDIIRRGKDDVEMHRQRYECHGCQRRFDDLTNTIFAGRHQALKTWILCLYLMGLNLSSCQIAQELDLNEDDVLNMAAVLRQGIVDKKPDVTLSGEVECDEVYVTAGHKGYPEAVKKRGAKDAATVCEALGGEARLRKKNRLFSA